MNRMKRLNIDMDAEEFKYLKLLCAKEGITIKDFVAPLIYKAIEEYEDDWLANEADKTFKKLKSSDFIPFETEVKPEKSRAKNLRNRDNKTVRKKAKIAPVKYIPTPTKRDSDTRNRAAP